MKDKYKRTWHRRILAIATGCVYNYKALNGNKTNNDFNKINKVFSNYSNNWCFKKFFVDWVDEKDDVRTFSKIKRSIEFLI